ncbi:MAG: hypothetical protein AB7P94_17270 [Steroidobacteraceae bacterium]
MNINDLTIGDIKTIQSLFSSRCETAEHWAVGRRCLVRTYSAGVHIGDVVWVNPTNNMEIKLENSLRLWKWEGGGLSLSAVANNGIKGGRLNRTGEVGLTNAIEFIPTTKEAELTYERFIED